MHEDVHSARYRSASVLPLVEELSVIHHKDSRSLIELIGKIKSHHYFTTKVDPRKRDIMSSNYRDKMMSIRKLHGVLMLHLGSMIARQTSIEAFCSVVFCLRELYANDNIDVSECIAEDEFEELFVLVPKILLRASSGDFDNLHVNFFRQDKMHEIVVACNQIMESWLLTPLLVINALKESTTTSFENFLLGFIISMGIDVDMQSRNTAPLEIHEILRSLRMICTNQQSGFWHSLDAMALAIDSSPRSSYNNLSPQLHVFYWRCVSRIPSQSRVNSGSSDQCHISDLAVKSLIPFGILDDVSISTQAIMCIAEFIKEAGDSTHSQLLEFLTERILTTYNDECNETSQENGMMDDNFILQLLECFRLCMKRKATVDRFTRMERWEEIFDILISNIADKESVHTSEKATAGVLPIVKFLVTTPKQQSRILFQKSIDTLPLLLSIESSQIIESTLNLLSVLVQDSEVKRRTVISTKISSELITALAVLSSKTGVVTDAMKTKLVECFTLLVQDVKNLHFLARQATNLSFLVDLASGSYCQECTDQELRRRVQQISISVLLKLARNPCNRRILSKRPGLLSSLIQYTRGSPEDADLVAEGNGMTRAELKGRILRIADAL